MVSDFHVTDGRFGLCFLEAFFFYLSFIDLVELLLKRESEREGGGREERGGV